MARVHAGRVVPGHPRPSSPARRPCARHRAFVFRRICRRSFAGGLRRGRFLRRARRCPPFCARGLRATRLLTQLPTSVGPCSDRRQSTSSRSELRRRYPPARQRRTPQTPRRVGQPSRTERLRMPATSMLSLVQRALRNLLVGDDEVVPACGCSRADGVAEPTSPLAPLFGGPSQRSEFNDPGGRPPLPLCQAAPSPPSAGGSPPAERRTRPSSQPPRHPTRHWPSRLVTRLTYDTMTRRSGEY